MFDADALIVQAMTALQGKLSRDGLPTFSDTRTIVIHALLRLHNERVEHLLAYWLDGDMRLLAVEALAIGAETEASFSTAHVARRSLASGATYCALVHNHPQSNDPSPSDQDVDAASRIDRSLAAIGVMCVGHYVVTLRGVGDVRTRAVTLFETPPKGSIDCEASYCPHCSGKLEATT